MTIIRLSKGAVRGFSLIELLVAITIGGVLLSIAWVRMSTLVPIYRLEGAARTLGAEIQKARGRAIAENKCFTVVIDTSAKTYQLQNKTAATLPCGTASYAADPADVARKIDDADALTLAFTQGSSPVIFSPRGGAENSPAPVLVLTNTAGATRSILVQSTGRVNVQ
jgi:prepilin-type N-terminal cleavage/methylation domain-containing protein